MNSKYKLLILYHSGAGSTKTIAEIYCEKLNPYYVDICSIDLEYDYKKLMDYDFFIFAFPTYHCEPSTSMLEFVRNIPVFSERKRAFVFTTCGLYSGNALRRFIRECSIKNITTCGYSKYRAPATDGVLLLPPIRMMFKYEKNITHKIRADIDRVKEIIETDIDKIEYPPFKLYTILNYPNKVLGKAYKHNIKLLEEYCVKCNKCINSCIRNCWREGTEYPDYNVNNCEYCFRCVHHCPNEAIILSAKTRKKIKFNEKFYSNLKKEILQQI